jgi:hypothetical protein
MSQFWLPTSPCTAVDALNQAWLATGSARNAVLGAHADYNGHRYEVFQSEPDRKARTWSVMYFWGGTHYVARRVPLEDALRMAVEAASRGRGGSVLVNGSGPDVEAACLAAGLVPYEGPKTALDHAVATMPWQCGGRWLGHTAVGYAFDAVRLERTEGISTHLFLEATSYEDWQAKVDAARAARRAR